MPWQRVAQSNAVVQANTANTLYMSDLDTLCTRASWMTDALIHYGVVACDAYGAPLTDLANNVLWIPPAVVKLGKDGDDQQFLDSLGRTLGQAADLTAAPALARGAKVILFPVNQGNTHWSLLAFYKDTREFVHYDSIGSNDDAAADLIAKLRKKGYLRKPLEFAKPREIVKQMDGHNCGLYVVQYARAIMALPGGDGRPSADTLKAITSESSEQTRYDLLVALRPLVDVTVPEVEMPRPVEMGQDSGPRKKSPEEGSNSEKEERQEARAKLQEHVESEEDLPVGPVAPCEKAKAAIILVELKSTKPRILNVESAKVTFEVGADKVVRRTGKDGKTTLKVPPGQKAKITAVATLAAEFEIAEKSASVDVKEGENPVELLFTPKDPRRFHAKFVFLDDAKKQRPFPAGFKVELGFDDGLPAAGASLTDKGVLTDDGDKQPGARIPWSTTRVWPRFPDAQKRQHLAWRDGSAEDTATSLLDELKPKEKPPEGRRAGVLLPRGVWYPTADAWTLPDEHKGAKEGETKRHVDVPKQAAQVGREDRPLLYVLKQKPSNRLMNGHPIDHVVVLMLENRGFDHFMGYLYEGTQPKHHYPASPKGKHADLRPFEGMEGIDGTNPVDYLFKGTTLHAKQHFQGSFKPRRGTRASNVPRINPHEDFVHIFQDMYGAAVKDPHALENKGNRDEIVRDEGGKYKVPPMDGFALNYCDGILHHKGEGTKLTDEIVSEIMDMFLPDQIPVMSGLARHYGVSDLYFCSVPSQTNTNRAFWVAGSAAGLVKNNFYCPNWMDTHADKMPAGSSPSGIPYRRCLFTLLQEEGVSWKYYQSSAWPPPSGHYFKIMFDDFAADKYKANLPGIDRFFKDIEEDKLPDVSYIEPTWGGGNYWDWAKRMVGNEFHPVADMFMGEFFVKKVYEKLSAGPKWDKTLFVITFDENGGTYDHLAPWDNAPKTGRDPAADNYGARVKGTAERQYGFEFDCYGIRVPTLLINKHVKPETIFRSPTELPYDHTSIISTILKWLQIDPEKWKLGDRVKVAPTFDGALEGSDVDEAERRKTACGVEAFSSGRKARNAGLNYGDKVRLKYVGDRWVKPPPRGQDYLGGPYWPGLQDNWWYTIATAAKDALVFEFAGGNGPVKVGLPLIFKVATGKAKNYQLAVPEANKYTSVYLSTDSDNNVKWRVWLVNDRNEGTILLPDDEVLIFSERYMPENVSTALLVGYDPYQRLSLDAPGPNPQSRRYGRFRAGEWDIWRLEKA